MDDLDHSMHISECDWTSFYEESEECCLLQPSLACPDSSSLSDSEDSGSSSSVSSVEHISGQITCSGTEGGQPDHSTVVHITTTLQTELNVQSSEDAEMQMESDSSELASTQEPDPLPCNRTELNANKPHASDRAESEDARGIALRRAEKERWFVTVNDSPARQQVHSTSVKKKRRQKKTCKRDDMFKRGQERSLGNSLKLEKMRGKNESEGGTDAENGTQVNQNFVKEATGSAEEAPESIQMGGISDSSGRSLTSSNKEELSEKLEMSHSPKADSDPVTDSSSHCVLTPKEPSRLDSVESDELEDAVEFLSTHSFDSESYLSATESVEELLHLLMENQQLQSSLSVTENGSDNIAAANFEGHGSTDVQPSLTFPSAAQSADKMPDDNSTCDNDTLSMLSTDTRGFQKHEVNLSASACSSGVELLPVPNLTVTPCSVADSPETYAKAEGHLRPVYAISAFWDEMEKLTINDILQLRMGRSIPPRETQQTATPDVDNHSLVDTLECNSSDGGLMDTSDTADSDYFTQPDESKPDRSSCEFSTSEFEEEYWQFLGTSRNSSPNLQSEIQQSTSDFSSLAHEDEESTSSEGKETPVPSEDFMRKSFEDHNSDYLNSSKLVWPRKMTKSKSVHNVQALNTEDLSLLLSNDESSLLLSSCPPPDDNVALKANDSLATLTPAPFPDELYHIPFPEKFEYLFKEDKAESDSQWVTVYEPEELSVFDYPLCTFRDEMSFFSLSDYQHNEEKPIPIFSCSHPTVRELTFPNPDYVFLGANCEEDDVISPIRVVSCSFIQDGGFHSWRSLMRKIHFPDKGSLWCRRSGPWVFPIDRILIKSSDLPVQTEDRVSPCPSQLFGELVVQQRVLEAIQTTRREGIFSTLRQSDMCLVCIAFASWVLKSSDPEAADAWKAALLANVSALSAIQYLRQYVRKQKSS